MRKLSTILMASAVALAMHGAVLAQNQENQARDPGTSSAEQQHPSPTTDSQAQGAGGPPDRQAEGGHPGQNDEYQAALKKCESLTGSQRDQCVDKAKKDHGLM